MRISKIQNYFLFLFFGNQENCIKTRNLQEVQDSACLNTTQKCQILKCISVLLMDKKKQRCAIDLMQVEG